VKLKNGGEAYWTKHILEGRGFEDFSARLGAFGASECARCGKKVGLDMASLIAKGGLGIRCLDCLHVFCLSCARRHFGAPKPRWWDKWQGKWPFKQKTRRF